MNLEFIMTKSFQQFYPSKVIHYTLSRSLSLVESYAQVAYPTFCSKHSYRYSIVRELNSNWSYEAFAWVIAQKSNRLGNASSSLLQATRNITFANNKILFRNLSRRIFINDDVDSTISFVGIAWGRNLDKGGCPVAPVHQ